MSQPSPDRATAARAAAVLAKMAPHDAGRAAAQLVETIYTHMLQLGYTDREAKTFCVDFTSAMVEAIRAMAEPRASRLH